MFCVDCFSYVCVSEVECGFELIPLAFFIMPIAICDICIHLGLAVICPILDVSSFHVVEAKSDLFVGLLKN
jgi:hypothetical protein